MTQGKSVSQVRFSQGLDQIRCHAQHVGAKHIGAQLVADSHRIAAAPANDVPRRDVSMGKRLARLCDNGDVELLRPFERGGMPVVG